MEWKISTSPVPYEEAVAFMEARVQAIHQGEAGELVWLLEHPSLYTAGTSADAADLLDARFPVYATGRGGQYTYHGPGQRIAYVMLDLTGRGQDLRAYVQNLEFWLIDTLAAFNVKGEIRQGRVGVWVNTKYSRSRGGVLYDDPAQRGGAERGRDAPLNNTAEAKIAALGVRVRKWVTYHGVALNVSPDLSHYAGIVPCGVREFGVTSLAALGLHPSMGEVDAQLRESFAKICTL